MRKITLAAAAALATVLALAAPGAAFAADRADEALLVDLDAAVRADVDLGHPAVLPLCLGADRSVLVIDHDAGTRTLHCVSADVAADLDAEVRALH